MIAMENDDCVVQDVEGFQVVIKGPEGLIGDDDAQYDACSIKACIKGTKGRCQPPASPQLRPEQVAQAKSSPGVPAAAISLGVRAFCALVHISSREGMPDSGTSFNLPAGTEQR